MAFQDLIPESCVICGSVIGYGAIFCGDCGRYALDNARPCEKCGDYRIAQSHDGACLSCRGRKLYFDSLFSPFIYAGAIAEAVRRMKYGPDYKSAVVLGRRLAENIPSRMLIADEIVFAPMARVDKFFRSFNQAEIMAEQVSLKTGIPLNMGLLEKVKKTKKQADLSHDERLTNLNGAFEVRKRAAGRKFLLIDDVSTTMSTVNEISQALKKAGADKIFVAVLARKSVLFD